MAKKKTPLDAARQLGNLDLLLYSRDAAGVDSAGRAFLVAHSAVPEGLEERLMSEFRRTLAELGIPPSESAVDVVENAEGARQGGRRRGPASLLRVRSRDRIVTLTEDEFFNRTGVHHVPGLYPGDLSPEQLVELRVLSLRARGELPMPRNAMGDAYARHVVENRQAAVYIDRTRIGRSSQWGLFAGRPIKRHEYIGEYAGSVLPDDQARGSNYVYEYPFVANVSIDAKDRGNLMRFANNSQSADNVYPLPVFANGFWHMVFVAKKLIAEGEQILCNYGSEYFKDGPAPEDLRP
jgi:hypothetical protein